MKALKYLLFFTLLGLGGAASAQQDIHFTMFDMAPINTNPVFTGYYSGTFRIGGIYRSQWQSLGLTASQPDNINNPGAYSDKFTGFKTPSAYVDLPFGIRSPKNFGDLKHWAGVGLNFYSDQRAFLKTLKVELALAYHLGLGARGNTRLSLGVKGGIFQHDVGNASDYVFENDILFANGIINTATPETFPNQGAAQAADFSAGLMFAHKATGWGIELAGSFNHFTSPKMNVLATDYNLASNIIGTARLNFAMGRKLTLRPMYFFQYMAGAMENTPQLLFAIHFNNTKDANLLLGGGYRIGDAAFARVGFEFKGLIFGAAYDFNLSSLSLGNNSNYTGANARGMGFELGLSYIAKIYKELKVNDILYNPRF